jgi:hypothetical protein
MVRGKGGGSIYQRSDGRWEAQIEAGRSPAGRRRYARGVRRTRKDAQKELKELQRPSDAGVMPGQASMVSVFMAWWLGHVVPGTVTDETVTRYRWITDHWITPHVGTVRFNKLTPTHMQAMLVRLEEAGLSPSPAPWPAPSWGRPPRWAEQTGTVGRNVARLVDGPQVTANPPSSHAFRSSTASTCSGQRLGGTLHWGFWQSNTNHASRSTTSRPAKRRCAMVNGSAPVYTARTRPQPRHTPRTVTRFDA